MAYEIYVINYKLLEVKTSSVLEENFEKIGIPGNPRRS